MQPDLVMLVTGNSSGIGKHITNEYLERGFKVIGCSRREVDFKSENYHHFALDIRDEKSVIKMFSKINAKMGKLDILINNAGVASMNYIMLSSYEEMKKVVETNLYGTFLSSREGIKLMRKNKFGRIINISSIHTDMEIEGCSIYSSTKAAIEKFSRQIAKEIYPYGITSNTISLSVVSDTGMSKNLSESVINKIIRESKSRKMIEIEHVIRAIDNLISSDTDKITGEKIVVG